MKLTKANVLVTGGAGFAGSHLVEELINEGAHVIVVDIVNDQRGYFSRSQLGDKATLLNIDVNNFEALYDVVTKFKIEAIFHLAAQAIVEIAYENPKQTLTTNILGTINVMECARLSPRIKAIIVASSDKAYGKLSKNQYHETDPLEGDHPYDVSKSSADLIARSYFSTYSLPVVVTRFGNIYGEGDLNSSRIIPSIINSLITGEVLELRSDGSHVRDYLYVKDVAQGYIALAQNIEKVKGESFNFGSDDTYSVTQLINKVEQSTGKQIKFKILNIAVNEIPYQSLHYAKVTKAIGWKPKFSIAAVINNLLSYEKENS